MSLQSPLLFTRDNKLNINSNSADSKFVTIEKTTEPKSLNGLSAFIIKKVIVNIANEEVELCKKL